MGKNNLNDPSTHHQVPSSMGGTNDDINLFTSVRTGRHADYHTWAANKTPCFALRYAATNAIGGPYTPDPESLQTIQEITSMYRWQKLYHPKAIYSVADTCSIAKSIKSSEFQITHWKEEEVLIRKILHALLNGGKYPVVTGESNVELYFALSMKEKTLKKSMKRMMMEKGGRVMKRFLWVNPMQHQTRESLVKCIEESTRVKIDNHKNDFERLLLRQQKKLTLFIKDKVEEVLPFRNLEV